MLAAIEPGTGYVRAMAANRNYSLDTSQNEPSSDDAKRALGHQGHVPEHDQPAAQPAAATSAATRPARRSRSSRCWRRWRRDTRSTSRSWPGRPTSRRSIRPASATSAPAPTAQHWCPRNASPSHERPSQHVDRLRPVGQHVLRAAAGEGRRRERHRDGQAAGRQVPQLRRTSRSPKTGTSRICSARSRSASPTPFRWSSPTRTRPLPRTGFTASRCRWSTILDFFGEKVPDVADPRCTQAVSAEIARAAADAARCPINDRGGLNKCAGGTTDRHHRRGRSATR